MLNVIVMGLSFDDISSDLTDILRNVNLVFTSIFIMECSLKLVALGAKQYFSSSWNTFDFIVVLTSIIDLLMDALGN